MSAAQRCLSMAKGRHRFVFRYVEGTEADLLASFVELANDPDSEFDWFDAAVLAYEMGQQLSRELSVVAQVEKARDVQHANSIREPAADNLRRK